MSGSVQCIRATNIGFLTPSVTTYKGLNPSYRLYTVDGFDEGSSLVKIKIKTVAKKNW
jgi:hypothetical protein